MGSFPKLLFAFQGGFPSPWTQPALPSFSFPSACVVFQDLQYFCNFSIPLVLSLQLSKFIYSLPQARVLPTNTRLSPGSCSPVSHPSSAPGPPSLLSCTR